MSKGKEVVSERVINVTTDQAVMGAVIAQLRESHKMQKQELAEKLGLSPSAWSRVEKGETTLTAFQLRRITEIFCVSSDKVFRLAKEAEDKLQASGFVVESSDFFKPKVGWISSGVVGAAGAVAGISAVATIPVFGAVLAGLVGAIVGGAITSTSETVGAAMAAGSKMSKKQDKQK